MQVEEKIEIARPVADVFAFVEAPESAPRWLSMCAELKQTSPGARGVGSTFDYAYREGGRTRTMKGEMVAYEPARRFTIRCVDAMFEAAIDFRFAAIGGSTAMAYGVDMRARHAVARLLMAPMGWFIRRATLKQMRADLARLKSLLEQ